MISRLQGQPSENWKKKKIVVEHFLKNVKSTGTNKTGRNKEKEAYGNDDHDDERVCV